MCTNIVVKYVSLALNGHYPSPYSNNIKKMAHCVCDNGAHTHQRYDVEIFMKADLVVLFHKTSMFVNIVKLHQYFI